MKPHRTHILDFALTLASAVLGATSALAAAKVPAGPAQSTGPIVAFTHHPPQETTDRFARFEFSANDADGYICAIDDKPIGQCSSPYLLMPRTVNDPALAPGPHRFTVQATLRGVRGPKQSAHWKITSVLQQAKAQNPQLSALVTVDGTAPADYRGARADASYIKGIARFKCLESHVAYDDPIVYFGNPGRAHLHSFWGNLQTNAHSSAESLFTLGDTSCQGNSLNRSAYWVPALLAPTYSQNGARSGWQPVLKDADERALARGLFHETYYYSAVITKISEIGAPPPGLRVIAGTATATNTHPANNAVLDDPHHIAHWYCATRRSTAGRPLNPSSHVPECPISKDAQGRDNMLVHYVIRFPSCWDGVHLDSPDHKSHMAYVAFAKGTNGSPDRSVVQCPLSHPVAIPEVSYHYSFAVTEANADPITKTSRGWRLASDNYAVGRGANGLFAWGGESLHGDWFNAWHPEVIQAFIDGCLKQRKDCRDGQLGAPDPSGEYFVLGRVNRVRPMIYPELPNTETSGMPAAMPMHH